jgi:hypothetical protein
LVKHRRFSAPPAGKTAGKSLMSGFRRVTIESERRDRSPVIQPVTSLIPARERVTLMAVRWVAHLPFTAVDLPAARRFAGTMARSLAFLAELDPGETTVSAEDDQGVRHRIFCDRRLPGGRRCVRPDEHSGQCA